MGTNYGIKDKGKSRFIIVAPHAAGDDLRTEELAQSISEKLKAFVIINNKYIKPTNSRAKSIPNLVRDFNKLPLKKGKYKWGEKKGSKHMKEFYDDIMESVKSIHKSYSKKAIIVFIHGMKDGDDEINIDIGFGVKEYKGKLLGTKRTKRTDRHPDAGSNTGVVRANRECMENLKKVLSKFDLKIGIGKAERIDKYGKKIQFAAWSKMNGIQYFVKNLIKIPTHSFQLEIASKFRKRNHLEHTSKIISKALKSVYKEFC